ncbi:hypothetical protein C8F01DRAFT_1103834 [Mycena amicta]|nr:hypothetical protein C8F01DRAFT_1103834 [Mycena amicta]
MSWIYEHVVKLAEEHGANISSAPRHEKGRRAQIKQFFNSDSENAAVWALVSDKSHYIAVKFPKDSEAANACHARYGRRMPESKSAVVVLKNFKLICARIPSKGGMTAESFIALDCDSVEILNRHDESGQPTDINEEEDIRKWVLGLRQPGGAGNVLRNRKPVLEEYKDRWSEQSLAPLHFIRESTLRPTSPICHPPVDARELGSSSPSQKYSSPAKPISDWELTPRKEDAPGYSSESDQTPPSSPAPHKDEPASSQEQPDTSYLAPPTPAQRQNLKRPSPCVGDDSTPRMPKRQRRISESPPVINRKVSRPPEPPMPASSGPTVILAPNSEPSESQPSVRDEDDEQTETRLFGRKQTRRSKLEGFSVSLDHLVKGDAGVISWKTVSGVILGSEQ